MNRRMPEIWRQIVEYLGEDYFNNIKVLELGAGFGDLAILMANAGAQVLAVDNDLAIMRRLVGRLLHDAPGTSVRVSTSLGDAEHIVSVARGYDLVTCTSLLPYLSSPNTARDNMARAAKAAIIECQYAGDGPGPFWLENDEDMLSWLSKSWNSVTKIGETHLDIRPASRSIWYCTHVEDEQKPAHDVALEFETMDDQWIDDLFAGPMKKEAARHLVDAV